MDGVICTFRKLELEISIVTFPQGPGFPDGQTPGLTARLDGEWWLGFCRGWFSVDGEIYEGHEDSGIY